MLPHETTSTPAIIHSFAADRSGATDGVAHRDKILRHLIELYLTGDSLPSGMPTRFSVAEFHRLFRYVVQEGYGE